MADTQHPIADAGANTNSAAEKDVQDVLAELKAEEVKNADGEASAPAEQGTNEKPSDGAQGDTNAADDEEAKIIAAANKLGQESASDEKTKQRDQRGSRAGQNGEKKRVNYRENIKSDVTTLEETNDPEQIRKQVCAPSPEKSFTAFNYN